MLGQRRGNLVRRMPQVREVLLDFGTIGRRQCREALLEALVELGTRVQVAGAEVSEPKLKLAGSPLTCGAGTVSTGIFATWSASTGA
jgi:hypothetical protein